jgi:hypothetical protein
VVNSLKTKEIKIGIQEYLQMLQLNFGRSIKAKNEAQWILPKTVIEL